MIKKPIFLMMLSIVIIISIITTGIPTIVVTEKGLFGEHIITSRWIRRQNRVLTLSL